MLDVLQGHRGLLQKMSEQVLAAQEDERKRIARELHDETAQALTTLLIRLKILETLPNPDEMSGQIDELRELTAQTLEAVRKLAVELRPSHARRSGAGRGPRVRTRIPTVRACRSGGVQRRGFHDREPACTPQVELVLYRVVQEALTNAAKPPAAARRACRVRATKLTRSSRRVTDDGEGFDVEEMMRLARARPGPVRDAGAPRADRRPAGDRQSRPGAARASTRGCRRARTQRGWPEGPGRAQDPRRPGRRPRGPAGRAQGVAQRRAGHRGRGRGANGRRRSKRARQRCPT